MKELPEIKGYCYHRNGIGGRGFYAFVATIQYVCSDGTVEHPETYLVTWSGFDDKEDWDNLTETDYRFVQIGAFGPDTSVTKRGDNLIWAIREPLKKLSRAWFRNVGTYNYVGGKVVRVGY